MLTCVILPDQEENSAEAGKYHCYTDSPTCNVPSSHSLSSLSDADLHRSSSSGCSTPPQEPRGLQRLHGQESVSQTLHH